MSERHEGVVRLEARMFALVAEMEAVKARIEAMKVDNEVQQANGGEPAWNVTSFLEMAGELEEIAKGLRTEI